MTRRQAVVTGADGFVGGWLLHGLGALGWHVTAIAGPRRESLPQSTNDVAWLKADLRNEDSLAAARLPRGATWFHLAAAGVRASEEEADPLTGMNARGSANAARLAFDTDAARFVHVGSGFEYAPSDKPITEYHPIDPSNAYGIGKAAGWRAVQEIIGSREVCIRPFSICGVGEHALRFFPYVADCAIKGEPALLTEGTQVRDYVGARDVAEALIYAATSAELEGDVFNIGGGPSRANEVRRVATRIFALAKGDESLLRFGAVQPARPEPRYFVADIEKAERVLCWRPRGTLDDMIAGIVMWRREVLAGERRP